MKNFISSAFCLLLLGFSFSCNPDENEMTPQRTLQDIEADFQSINISPGIEDVELEMFNGEIYRFRVIAPERSGSENRPLMLALHGATSTPDAHQNTACYVEPGLASLDAFILSPFAEGGLWYTEKHQKMLGDLMYLSRKYWPIDEEKIAVTGYSNGGNASWQLAYFQSGTLSAAIPMASSYDVHDTEGNVRKWEIPLYVIHGENDELFPVQQTQEWVEATVAAGSDVTFVIAPGLGHYEPCSYVPYLKDATIWLLDEVWK